MDMCDYFERQMAENGWYYHLRDFASKEGNKVARLAALFHYFSGAEGNIPEATVMNAQKISEWYLNEALALFGPVPEVPQHIQDAELLWQWLDEHFMDNNGQPLKRSWATPAYPKGSVIPGDCGRRYSIFVRSSALRSGGSTRRHGLPLTAGCRMPAEHSGRLSLAFLN